MLYAILTNCLSFSLSLYLCSSCSSLMERWLRKHLPFYEDYPESHAPIGHNTGYHMVPFMPIYRNIEYLLSKNLGYEYDYLADHGQCKQNHTQRAVSAERRL